MLQAKNQTGKLVTLALLDHQEIEIHKQQSTFTCPQCKEPVIMKIGQCRVPHFAHRAKSSCPFSGGGEGDYHERGKVDLYRWLKKQGVKVKLEVYLPDIKQRPDLLIKIGTKVVVIEYQCATISLNEFIRRNQGYQQLNMTPIWILGGNRMKRTGSLSLQTSTNDLMFLHQFSQSLPLMLYFYCPDTTYFSIAHHIQTTGGRQSFVQLYFNKLSNIHLNDLWKNHPTYQLKLYQKWKQDKQRFRTIPIQHGSTKQRQWLQWIYLQHLHPSQLPSIIHLPVPGQFLMNSPPWIWQSRIVLHLFRKQQVLTKQMCDRLVQHERKAPHYFPLVKPTYDPVNEYLQLLVKLNYLDLSSRSLTFKVIKPISFFERVEDAIDGDNKIINQLSKL